MNKIPAGYKKTEVGIIPEDWKTICIGDLVKSLEAGISVNSVEKDSVSFAHGLSVLKTSCVIGGKFIPEEHKAIIPRDIFRAKLNPRQNSIIISRMNTPALVGECGYVERDCPRLFLPDRLWMTRHDNRFPHDVRWLAYLLSFSAFNRAIKESATGTSGSMKNISKASLFAVLIPFPRHSEQTAIATALNDADALITQLEKLIAKKRLIKQGAMQQLLKPQPGWQTKELGACLKESPSYGINAPAAPFNEALPLYLRITDITDGGKYFKENAVSVNSFSAHLYYLESGDLVYARTGASVGKTYLYDEKDGRLVFAGFLIRVRTNAEILLPEFFKYFTQTSNYWNWVRSNSMRTGQPGINGNEYKKLPVSFPSIPEQTRIAQILSDMDTELDALEARLAKHKQIKQGMMQTLLTGKIRLL